MTASQLPRLRAVDARPFAQGGQSAVLLRDPLQLTNKAVVIPQQLAPVLALCDGTRDVGALCSSLAIRFGLFVGPDEMGQLLVALDEALLLDNDRFAQARAQVLEEYRQAPHRPLGAGAAYPADADELRQLLQGFLDAEDVEPGGTDVRGLVSPHIDYARGGAAYARVWKRASEAVQAAELVVLLGTDHYGDDGRLTLTRQHYATPLGVLPTAQEVVESLGQTLGAEAAFADELHHRSEHSIDLAAVWLHHVRQGQPCPVVPILCGSFGHFVRGEADPAGDPAIEGVVEVLQEAMAGRRALVVAAADLSHVGPAFGGPPQGLVERARLQAADEELVEQVCAGDAAGFHEAIKGAGDRYNVCGLPPIYLALRLLTPVQGESVAYDRCPADAQGTSWVSTCGVVLR